MEEVEHVGGGVERGTCGRRRRKDEHVESFTTLRTWHAHATHDMYVCTSTWRKCNPATPRHLTNRHPWECTQKNPTYVSSNPPHNLCNLITHIFIVFNLCTQENASILTGNLYDTCISTDEYGTYTYSRKISLDASIRYPC